MGRRFSGLLCALALLGSWWGVLARAEVVQKGPLRVAFAGKFTPRALPRHGSAPISVSIGGRISTSGGATPPQLRTISIAINRNGRLDPGSLPACRLRQIQPSTSAGALAACRGSLVGEGSFSADVKLPQQSPFPSRGKVLAFSGKMNGSSVVFAHVFGTDPVPTSYTLPFFIRRSGGTFATTLVASLPQVTSDWGFVTGIDLRLDRRFTDHGGRDGYLSAACPAPPGFPGAVFPLARASFAFAGGRTLSSVLNRSCTVTPPLNKFLDKYSGVPIGSRTAPDGIRAQEEWTGTTGIEGIEDQ